MWRWGAVLLFLSLPIFLETCSIPGIFDGAWGHTVTKLKEISKKCKELVVLTVITEKDETLKVAPVGWSSSVCSVAIVDPDTYSSIFANKTTHFDQASKEQKSKGWIVIKEDKMIFKNKLCNVNTVKSLMLKFVPYTKQAIYIDGGNYMERPLHNFIEAHISNKTNLFLIEHPDRKDVKEEINHAIHSHQAPEKVLKRQKEDYSLETRTSDYHSHHLYLGNFHYRRNVGPARAFGCLWFADMIDYANLDLLSLPKAIVNSGLESTTKSVSFEISKEFLAQQHHFRQTNESTEIVSPCGMSARRVFKK